MTPFRDRWVFAACVIAAAGLGAVLAPIATTTAARLMFESKVVGLTSMILVQLAHDAVALFTVALAAPMTYRWHRRAGVVFVIAGAVLLALAEPVLTARSDTVLAAWQGMRLVARLSAMLFAMTLASYWDSRRR